MAEAISIRERTLRADHGTRLHATVMEAASRELRQRPWSEITMSDIARSAGVERSSIYRVFRSREQLGRELAARETKTLRTALAAVIHRHRSEPSVALVEMFQQCLLSLAESPLASGLLADDDTHGLLWVPPAERAGLLARVTDWLAEAMVAEWPDLAHREACEVSETLLRLAISYSLWRRPPATSATPLVEALVGHFGQRLCPRNGAPTGVCA